jgi:FtsP/CotA-like multicopper oxidase with cupredoxin domain
MNEMSRRQFLRAGVVSVGATALVPGAWSSVATAAPGGGGAVSRYPLHVPPFISAQSALTAAPGRIDLGGGSFSNALMYNQTLPGPTFVVSRGTQVAASLVNHLTEPTTIHWHGLVVPTAADGQPQEAVAPGGSYLYSFTVNQRAALNFYHPHPHMMTGKQVYSGLAGAFVVRDNEEGALGLPGGGYEVPLVVRDASFDSTGNLAYGGKASGFLGKVPVVNGTLSPYMTVDRGVYRFRVVNAATARIFRLTLSNGAPFTLIGNDGGLLTAPAAVSAVDISPGERVDLLVDFSSLGASQTVTLRCALAGWDVLEFRGSGTAGLAFSSPTGLSTIAPLGAPAFTRSFSFDGMTRINGKVFDPARVDFQVPADRVETWTFKTSGNAPHPVHIHGASFQVMSRAGGRARLFPWEGGWKDTVLLNDGETVAVKIRFEPWQRGQRYLIHCHKLEHEDAGMMAVFTVV